MGKHSGAGKYVLLDLGNYFAAGKIIRTNPYMLTLEVYRRNNQFHPGYNRDTIHKVIPIDQKMAQILGPFSYPPTTTRSFLHSNP